MSDEMNSEIEFFFACHDFWYQHLIDIFCLQAYLKSPINYNGKTVLSIAKHRTSHSFNMEKGRHSNIRVNIADDFHLII